MDESEDPMIWRFDGRRYLTIQMWSDISFLYNLLIDGLLIYMLSNLSSNITVDWIATIVKKIDFLTYYTNFTYGMLNLTDIIFFLSVTGLFLFFTARVLEKRRWS